MESCGESTLCATDPCQQGAQQRHDGGVVLEGAGASARAFAECWTGPKRYHGLPRRFKRAIHAIDSTTIALVANCMDWAKHRRRKAAAKMPLRLNLQSFLPGFAVIEEASHHDDTRTLALCAGLQAGEIAVFDKAYVHFTNFSHLSDL